MSALKKIWVFLKSYWYIPVLIIVALVFKSKGNRIAEILKTAQSSHKKQLDAINNAEIEKQKSRQLIDNEYENAIKEIEDNYTKENKAISERDKKYVKSVIKEWTDDPDQMAERIRMKFGFEYIPKNKKDLEDE